MGRRLDSLGLGQLGQLGELDSLGLGQLGQLGELDSLGLGQLGQLDELERRSHKERNQAYYYYNDH